MMRLLLNNSGVLLVLLDILTGCTAGPLSCGALVKGPTEEWPQNIAPYDHIVIVVEENKGPADVICAGCAKFITELASEGSAIPSFWIG
jgi:hypothetical protein